MSRLDLLIILHNATQLHLTIDIGNTRTKWGLFNGGELVQADTWDFADVEWLHGLIQSHGVGQAIICSVADKSFAQELATALSCKCEVFTHQTPVPIINHYKTPETLGMDRVAVVVGAFSLYKNENVLVIDAGTCATVDFVDSQSNYQGGSISPGMQMRLDAMHHFTQRLPQFEANRAAKLMGQTTEEAIQSGAVNGFVLEMEGFIKHYQNETNDLMQVVTTGGNGAFLAERLTLPTQSFYPNLSLIGLNESILYAETLALKG